MNGKRKVPDDQSGTTPMKQAQRLAEVFSGMVDMWVTASVKVHKTVFPERPQSPNSEARHQRFERVERVMRRASRAGILTALAWKKKQETERMKCKPAAPSVPER